MNYRELDTVTLIRGPITPDGTIPAGTSGTILLCFPTECSAEAYLVDFPDSFDWPETVPVGHVALPSTTILHSIQPDGGEEWRLNGRPTGTTA
jgi:hypothetical protein